MHNLNIQLEKSTDEDDVYKLLSIESDDIIDIADEYYEELNDIIDTLDGIQSNESNDSYPLQGPCIREFSESSIDNRQLPLYSNPVGSNNYQNACFSLENNENSTSYQNHDQIQSSINYTNPLEIGGPRNARILECQNNFVSSTENYNNNQILKNHHLYDNTMLLTPSTTECLSLPDSTNHLPIAEHPQLSSTMVSEHNYHHKESAHLRTANWCNSLPQKINLNTHSSINNSPPFDHSTINTINSESQVQYLDCNKNNQNSRLNDFELDNWCMITYHEEHRQVGEIFKAKNCYSTVIIDGFVNPSRNGNRFCLGALSNINQSSKSAQIRLYIGKGIELHQQGDDIWLKNLCGKSVFLESYYLDRESNRPDFENVYKIEPLCYVKVFDRNECRKRIQRHVALFQAAKARELATIKGRYICNKAVVERLSEMVNINVDELSRFCILRISFFKGWGSFYPRRNIKETPNWIEVRDNVSLQFLNEMLETIS